MGDTPGIGTFYDFHKRLWLSHNNNLSDSVHPPKEKPLKPKGIEEKAAPVEKVTVGDLFRQFEESPATASIVCLTVTLAGIPIAIIITLDTTNTC